MRKGDAIPAAGQENVRPTRSTEKLRPGGRRLMKGRVFATSIHDESWSTLIIPTGYGSAFGLGQTRKLQDAGSKRVRKSGDASKRSSFCRGLFHSRRQLLEKFRGFLKKGYRRANSVRNESKDIRFRPTRGSYTRKSRKRSHALMGE